MSKTILRDPDVGLNCSETPFRPPKTLGVSDLAICNSCNLVFSSEVAGPKEIVILDKGGLQLNESPLVQLTYNTTTFGLAAAYIWQNGIHRNFKADKNFDLEMNLYFRDLYKPDSYIAVVIPITIDDKKGNPYFSEIATSRRTITMESLIEKGQPSLIYKGIDLRNRDNSKKQTAPQCQSLTASMNWIVFPSTFISSADANRLRSYRLPESNTLPAPDHDITLERARKLCMLIPKITLKSDKKQTPQQTGVYLTRALQCQRIDPEKDVRGDAVYLSGISDRTLEKELEEATNLNDPLDAKGKPSIRAKDIENTIAIIVGVILGIVLIALVIYGLYYFAFKRFLENVESLEKAITATPIPCKPPILF